MIVDASAVLAILLDEPDAEHFERTLADTSHPRISVATLLEATIVTEVNGGRTAGYALEELFEKFEIEFVPVTLEQAEVARQAWRRFGKGNHPARLNFGDCFAYALAKTTG